MAELQAFLAFAMRKLYSLFVALAFVATAALPTSAHAATYYDTATLASLQARLQALLVQVQQLQTELARIRAQGPITQPSVPEYRYCDGYYYTDERCRSLSSNLRDVEVDFESNYARVRIEYSNGRTVSRIYAADTREEVISFLMSETGATRVQIQAVISYDGERDRDRDRDRDREYDEDVDFIRVFIYSGDAHAIVVYEDFGGEYIEVDNETDRDEIIEELADELDMDEDDVEDVTTFYTVSSFSVSDIDVEIDEDDEEAEARVYFTSGHSLTITYDTEDEDEIIEELADDLDMDEDDVEDIVDFDDHNGSDDVDEIDVTIYEDEEEARARVYYDDGDTDTFTYNTDDEDEIIEELADDLDMDEDDVEDITDFTYRD